MKNIAKFIAAGSVLFALAACSHVAKFTTEDFVAISGTSYTVVESTTTLTIPVCAYPASGQSNTTVTFDVKNGTAVAGEDFTFAPANGVLNFAGEETQNITITIIGQPGVFTGDKSFVVELKDASNNYAMSTINSAKVNIKDEDHPLTALFGNYELNGVSFYEDDGYYPATVPMTIKPYEGDVTRVWMNGFVAFNIQSWYPGYFTDSSVYATVSSDLKTITIPVPQATPTIASAFEINEPFTMYKWDSAAKSFITENDAIVFTLDEESGAYVTVNPYGFNVPSVVKKGPLYDDLIMYSDMYPNYPTYFVPAE